MIAEKEYIFFCDESDRKGPFFSNFYGGVRVAGSHINAVNTALLARKQALGLNSEVKWEKTDAMNVERYEHIMHAFFKEVVVHSMAVRIMFTQNIHVPLDLTDAHRADAYYILWCFNEAVTSGPWILDRSLSALVLQTSQSHS